MARRKKYASCKWNEINGTHQKLFAFFSSSGKYTLNVCVVFYYYLIYWNAWVWNLSNCAMCCTPFKFVARPFRAHNCFLLAAAAAAAALWEFVLRFERGTIYIYIVSPVQAVECGGCTDDDDDFSSSQVSSYSHSLIFSNRIELRRCHSFMSWMLEHETDIVPLTCFYFVPIFSNFAATAAAAAHIGRCHWYVFGICSPFACTYCTRHKIIARFVCLY